MSAALSILMVIPSLPVGGAEWAFVRLANALAGRNQVTAYVPYRCSSAPALTGALRGVKLVSLPLPHPFFQKALYKLSLTLQRLLPSVDVEQRLHSWVLGWLHRLSRFDVVNPHLRSSALMVCRAFQHTPLPIVESDHGDYALLKKEDPELTRHQLLMQRVDAVICPSHHNARLISSLPWHLSFQQTVIPYSMPGAEEAEPRTDPTFTFGMVARGVAEKGWAEAIAAFRLARKEIRKPTRLVLVGDGPHLDKLKKTVTADEPIVFTGSQAHPADWISGFDVGLLPSYFTGESLPCAVIECLTLGKPVIATAVGGIPEMLEPPGGPCGLLVPLATDTGHADVSALAEAMRSLAKNDTLRQTLAGRASKASLRYDASTCAQACADFFRRTRTRLQFSTAPRTSTASVPKLI